MSALGRRYTDAVAYAAALHRDQRRKGTQIPYLAHLLSVSALVLEGGGDEDEAVAALLHDALEDQGHLTSYEEIAEQFGVRVADIVRACSDAEDWPKPPWHERKQRYVDHVRTAPQEVLVVSAADKLHNARAILADWRQEGDRLWSRFSGGPDDQLWYYGELCAVFSARMTRGRVLADELHLVVAELHRVLGRVHGH